MMFTCRLLRSHLKRRCRTYGQSLAFENDVLGRILYNSVLQSGKTARHWRNVKQSSRDQKRVEIRCDVEPVTLQYLDECGERVRPVGPDPAAEEPNYSAPYSLPYSISSKVIAKEDGEQCEDHEENEINYDRELCRFSAEFGVECV